MIPIQTQGMVWVAEWCGQGIGERDYRCFYKSHLKQFQCNFSVGTLLYARCDWSIQWAVLNILYYKPAKFKAVFDAKMFRDLSPSGLDFMASKRLKRSFTSEVVY